MPEVQKLYAPEAAGMGKIVKSEEPSLLIVHFKSTWELFVDNIMCEWNTLNIVSVLLLTYVSTSCNDCLSLTLAFSEPPELYLPCFKSKVQEMTLSHRIFHFSPVLKYF
jgi:hypothetical protein